MTQAVLEGVAFAIRDSFEVAKSLGIHIERTKICGGGAKSPLWRKIIANVLNIKVDTDRFRGGTGAWRCDACCSCGWNLCIGGRGGCKDRESGGNRRTGSGDRRKIRDTVSEICADLSDGESVIPEAFLNTDECTDNKVMEKRAGN